MGKLQDAINLQRNKDQAKIDSDIKEQYAEEQEKFQKLKNYYSWIYDNILPAFEEIAIDFMNSEHKVSSLVYNNFEYSNREIREIIQDIYWNKIEAQGGLARSIAYGEFYDVYTMLCINIPDSQDKLYVFVQLNNINENTALLRFKLQTNNLKLDFERTRALKVEETLKDNVIDIIIEEYLNLNKIIMELK